MDVTPHNIFRKRLRECRQLARRSIDSVSFESGYSRSYIARLERGEKANPTIHAVWCIAEVLGVQPAYLLGLEDSAHG